MADESAYPRYFQHPGGGIATITSAQQAQSLECQHIVLSWREMSAAAVAALHAAAVAPGDALVIDDADDTLAPPKAENPKKAAKG